MKVTLGIREALLCTACFGLGYAKALQDTDEIIVRLAELKVTLDELVKTLKYGDVYEGHAVDVEKTLDTQTETPEGEPVQ